MLLLKTLAFLALLSVSKCKNDLEKKCKDDYRDLNNNKIDVNKYCAEKWCIQKCCPPEHFINPRNKECIRILNPKLRSELKELLKLIDYENITFYSNTEPRQKIKGKFKYIQNYKNNNMSMCGEINFNNPYEYYFTEKATLKVFEADRSKKWYFLDNSEYCVDYTFVFRNGKITLLLIVKEYYVFKKDNELNNTLLLTGLLISSVFLLLVFIVHCMLKTLHSSFTGLLMMAYTITILLGFIVKVIMQANIRNMNNTSCKIITPVLYFLLMSSFFWLNSFSVCIWRGLRVMGVYKATRREKLMSFCRYSLYAWGVPLVITGIVTYLDNIDLSKIDYIVKPPFDDCFKNETGVKNYYFIPLGVIMSINIVLFVITIYHILTTRYSTKRNAEFKRSGRENSYKTYMKLSLTMGISWVLELIPNSDNTFLFILSNTYNSLIGVIIFFVYIFDKNVLNELCEKFNIQNGFVLKIARRKSLFRLARSMKVSREESSSVKTTATALSSEAEEKTSLNQVSLMPDPADPADPAVLLRTI